jgi:DHA1 family bicyclomycin/chloramphenicol resistance-like MFS transporter
MTSKTSDSAPVAPAHPGGWLVATLLLQITFGVVAMTICLPSMPTWGQEFQASQASVQLAFSAYVVAFGGMQLVFGPWSDRIGRKPLLLGGMALALLGSVIAALAPDLSTLVLGRVLQGAGSAAGMSVGRAMVQDFFSEAHWLAALLGAYARLLREPAFLSYVLIMAMVTSAFYCFLSGAPIVLTHYGVTPDAMGWYIMAVPIPYFFGNMLTSRLVHRIGDRRLMALGLISALTGVSLMLLLAYAGLRTPVAFALPLTLLGLGHGLIAPAAISGSVGVFPALAGAAAAVAGASQQVMGSVGSYVVGLLAHDGPVNLGLLMLGFSLLGGLAQWLLHVVMKRRPMTA